MNSSALITGGAILFDEVYFDIYNSIFNNCKAFVGGAIRYLNRIPKMLDK